MRRTSSLMLFLAGFFWTSLAMAADPRVEAMGHTYLVLEEDTTVLSLFNLGNPAAAVFLPRDNRLDLNASVQERQRIAEFSTGVKSVVVEPVGNTYDSDFYYRYYYPHLDPFGNTLLPSVVYTRQARSTSFSLNDWEQTGYGGLMYWLDNQTLVQVVPKDSGLQRESTDLASDFSSYSAGGEVRAAWQALPGLGFGAGVSYAGGTISGWPELDGMVTELTPLSSFLRSQNFRESDWSLQAGGAWRVESVFDLKDHLDLGLLFHGTHSRLENLASAVLFDPSSSEAFDFDWTRSIALPWEMQLQGVYHYQKVMDIGLVAGFQNEETYRTFMESAGTSERRASGLDNIDYELSFRVKLPMSREDDLRFGVIFNNRGFEHPFPTGVLRLYDADGLYAQLPIQTASSSIGIAMGIVPAEGSLVAFQYNLGSSKSYQENAADLLADSGFTQFGLGAQYELWEGVALRLGFCNQQVSYQQLDVISSMETSSLRFGLGLAEGPWRVDLTAVAQRVTYSNPYYEGWTMLDKPKDLKDVDLDVDQSVGVLLGFALTF